MRRTASIRLTLGFLFLLTSPRTIRAEEQGLSLPELEARAVRFFPEVDAARAQLEELQAKLAAVRWEPLDDIRIEGILGLTPERRGDAIHSAQRDISFSDSWGVLVRSQLDLSIPLYTFGRHTAEVAAARAEVDQGKEKIRLSALEVRRQVQRAYHTLVLSQQSQSLLEEGQGYLERAQRYIETSLDEDRGTVTETDRLRLEVVAAEIEARLAEARRGQQIARAGLRTLAGLTEDQAIALPSPEPPDEELQPLAAYVEQGGARHPELLAAQAQWRARRALQRAARASFFPEIRLVGELDFAYSNVVDDQLSPFVNDPFNYLRYGVGVSLRWSFDFLTDRARLHQAEARERQAAAEERATRSSVTRAVEEAFINVKEDQHLMAARHRGRRAARGWLVSVMQGIDIGVLDPPELVDALKAYFEQSFLYLQALSQLRASLGQLELASGKTE